MPTACLKHRPDKTGRGHEKEDIEQLFRHVREKDHSAVLDDILDLVNKNGPEWVQTHIYEDDRGKQLIRFLKKYFSSGDCTAERVAAFLERAMRKLTNYEFNVNFRKQFALKAAWFWVGLSLDMMHDVEEAIAYLLRRRGKEAPHDDKRDDDDSADNATSFNDGDDSRMETEFSAKDDNDSDDEKVLEESNQNRGHDFGQDGEDAGTITAAPMGDSAVKPAVPSTAAPTSTKASSKAMKQPIPPLPHHPDDDIVVDDLDRNDLKLALREQGLSIAGATKPLRERLRNHLKEKRRVRLMEENEAQSDGNGCEVDEVAQKCEEVMDEEKKEEVEEKKAVVENEVAKAPPPPPPKSVNRPPQCSLFDSPKKPRYARYGLDEPADGRYHDYDEVGKSEMQWILTVFSVENG